MQNSIIIITCPLCGHIGIIHPETAPDPFLPESGFLNRCPGKRPADTTHKKQGSKTRGTDTQVRAFDNSRSCRFPFTDQNGKKIEFKIEYRDMLESGVPVADIAAKILSDHNADPGLWR